MMEKIKIAQHAIQQYLLGIYRNCAGLLAEQTAFAVFKIAIGFLLIFQVCFTAPIRE